jgi:signal transduction histidine kinase
MSHFLRLSAEQVNEREERLRKFNRTVAHELKNKVHALKSATNMLSETWVEGAERKRFEEIIARNASGLQRVLDNLVSLTAIQSDSRKGRHILLPEAASEAVRELREVAQAKGVEVRISDEMPAIEVDAATVELCLMNYVSNAIKYSDPRKKERWVTVEAAIESGEDESELVIRVCDNGLGVPADKRNQLFGEFYRAHDDTITEADGTGLGLSIVRETVESAGGRAWAEFPDGSEDGSIFAFALPSRRREDADAETKSAEAAGVPG